MWQDFGSKGTGVCIQSTTGRVGHSIKMECPEDLILQMHQCPYIDSTVQVPEFLSNIASVRKDVGFANQQEIRILAQVDATKGSAPLPGPDCKLIPVDLHVLLQRIVLGAAMSAEDEREIKMALVQAGLDTTVMKSTIRAGD
jgi:hypothetical protein